MAKITISKEIFDAHCPVGVDAESEIFDSLARFFDLAYQDLVSTLLGWLLGEELPTILDKGEEGDLAEPTDFLMPLPMSQIGEWVMEYICKRAMYIAIPSLDLVLTNNGFGVVNARDIIPAVPERVNRLRQQCYNDADRAYDRLLKGLSGNSLTHELLMSGRVWLVKTQHLVWTTEDFDQYCPAEGNVRVNRNELTKASGKLTRIENGMGDLISREQVLAFIDMMRGVRECSAIQLDGIRLLLEWLSEAYKNDMAECRSTYLLMSYMDKNIESFVEYQKSPQYVARHRRSFETTRKDGCFIFR